ncbi:MAG TPA: hypothetical protein VI756_30085 [Blastocatellia bacterium]
MVTQSKINNIRNNNGAAGGPAPLRTNDFSVRGAVVPLDKIADLRVVNGTINRRTALLIDNSNCREHALAAGKRLVSVMSALTTSSLYVYAFDGLAYPLELNKGTDAGWRDVLSRLTPGARTAAGSPLVHMRENGRVTEQIVIVTDGREDQAPRFADELDEYRRQLGVQPRIVIVRVGTFDRSFEEELRQNKADVRGVVFDGPGSLSRLIGILATPSRLDRLVDRIEMPAW